MRREIDRCDACGGAGRLSFDLVAPWERPVPLVECERCGSTGYLDPIASLVRAIERGQTLAWCMAHAGDGADPLPALWRASEATRAKFRLLELVWPQRRSAFLAQVRGGAAVEAVEDAAPSLAEVLEAVRARGE